MTATLDVNCINLNPNDSLDIIHKLNTQNKIQLHKTDTVDTEIIYGNPNQTNVDRLNKSQTIPEDKGAFTVGQSRVRHALVGSDKKLLRLKKSSELEEDTGIGFWDNSRLDHFKWGDDEKTFVDEFKEILFKDFDKMNQHNQRNALRDCMHLSTHLIYKREYFITTDKHFLNFKDVLKEKYDLNIIRPDDFIKLKEIQEIL